MTSRRTILSSERARTIQIIMAVIGFGLGGLTQVEAIVNSGYLPQILTTGGLVLAAGLVVLRRMAFLRANLEAGNRALAQQLLARRSRDQLSASQRRFIDRLLEPWWANGYWLRAGGRELEAPER